jgi:hypothetical protein
MGQSRSCDCEPIYDADASGKPPTLTRVWVKGESAKKFWEMCGSDPSSRSTLLLQRPAAFPHSALTRRVNCGVSTLQRTCELSAVCGTEATCRHARNSSRLVRTRTDSSSERHLGDWSGVRERPGYTARNVFRVCESEHVLCVLESEGGRAEVWRWW